MRIPASFCIVFNLLVAITAIGASCTGALTGVWKITFNQPPCTTQVCGAAFAYANPAIDSVIMQVCQAGNSLSGTLSSSVPTAMAKWTLTGNVTPAPGGVVGSRVNFDLKLTDTSTNPSCTVQLGYDASADGNVATQNSISGSFNSTASLKANCTACANVNGSCKKTGTFKIDISQGSGGGGGGGGNVTLTDVSVSSGIDNNSVATKAVQWIDFNRDGKLDLAIEGGTSVTGASGLVLYKNIGNGKFVDVTQQTNFSNGGRSARGATWADIDNSGFPSVFIANETGPPTLLLNQKGKFKDITSQISSPDATLSGASAWAGIFVDIDNDKLIDLFVVNDGAPNQLFRHTGATQFTDISTSAHIDFNGPGRSAVAGDFDGDGFQDLYLVNFKAPNKLYHNNKNNTFTEISGSAGVAFNGPSVQTV
ncbi:MAG: hypothetical protein C5B54_08495, partial [Acidobacteria bacterium]